MLGSSLVSKLQKPKTTTTATAKTAFAPKAASGTEVPAANGSVPEPGSIPEPPADTTATVTLAPKKKGILKKADSKLPVKKETAAAKEPAAKESEKPVSKPEQTEPAAATAVTVVNLAKDQDGLSAEVLVASQNPAAEKSKAEEKPEKTGSEAGKKPVPEEPEVLQLETAGVVEMPVESGKPAFEEHVQVKEAQVEDSGATVQLKSAKSKSQNEFEPFDSEGDVEVVQVIGKKKSMKMTSETKVEMVPAADGTLTATSTTTTTTTKNESITKDGVTDEKAPEVNVETHTETKVLKESEAAAPMPALPAAQPVKKAPPKKTPSEEEEEEEEEDEEVVPVKLKGGIKLMVKEGEIQQTQPDQVSSHVTEMTKETVTKTKTETSSEVVSMSSTAGGATNVQQLQKTQEVPLEHFANGVTTNVIKEAVNGTTGTTVPAAIEKDLQQTVIQQKHYQYSSKHQQMSSSSTTQEGAKPSAHVEPRPHAQSGTESGTVITQQHQQQTVHQQRSTQQQQQVKSTASWIQQETVAQPVTTGAPWSRGKVQQPAFLKVSDSTGAQQNSQEQLGLTYTHEFLPKTAERDRSPTKIVSHQQHTTTSKLNELRIQTGSPIDVPLQGQKQQPVVVWPPQKDETDHKLQAFSPGHHGSSEIEARVVTYQANSPGSEQVPQIGTTRTTGRIPVQWPPVAQDTQPQPSKIDRAPWKKLVDGSGPQPTDQDEVHPSMLPETVEVPRGKVSGLTKVWPPPKPEISPESEQVEHVYTQPHVNEAHMHQQQMTHHQQTHITQHQQQQGVRQQPAPPVKQFPTYGRPVAEVGGLSPRGAQSRGGPSGSLKPFVPAQSTQTFGTSYTTNVHQQQQQNINTTAFSNVIQKTISQQQRAEQPLPQVQLDISPPDADMNLAGTSSPRLKQTTPGFLNKFNSAAAPPTGPAWATGGQTTGSSSLLQNQGFRSVQSPFGQQTSPQQSGPGYGAGAMVPHGGSYPVATFGVGVGDGADQAIAHPGAQGVSRSRFTRTYKYESTQGAA